MNLLMCVDTLSGLTNLNLFYKVLCDFQPLTGYIKVYTGKYIVRKSRCNSWRQSKRYTLLTELTVEKKRASDLH